MKTLKRKAEEGDDEDEHSMWKHGGKWWRGPLIGRGSFGSVFLATTKKPKSQFSFFPPVMAVKSAEFSISGSIQKEKQVLDKVQGCPFVIQCFGEEITTNAKGEMVYNLLLEYASGGTLADHIRDSGGRGLDESVIRRYTKSILEGIHHVHECGYIHCDLKPENILLVPSSTSSSGFVAKIGDFGLAKKGRQRKYGRIDPSLRGTCMYMAPEVVVDNVQEPPSDIWALGCVVLEMFTSKHPWDRKPDLNEEDILRLISDKFESPTIPTNISKEGKEFLKGCLVRKSMFRLTAEMLLDHPFVAGQDGKESQTELNKVSAFPLIETEKLSFSLVSDDWISSSEGEFYFSEDDEEFSEEDEISSDLTVADSQGSTKSSLATCDGDHTLMRTLTQVSTIPAGF